MFLLVFPGINLLNAVIKGVILKKSIMADPQVKDAIVTMTDEEKEQYAKIKGKIEKCAFTTFIHEKEDEENITIVGYLPFIEEGDTLKLVGKMVVHQEYGEQFKIDTFEKIMPENSKALEKYLASGTIKGIGPATAKKIIDKFGEDSINVFKFEPLRLAEIKGISKDKAYEMGEEFNEKWELWQIVGFLEKFGVSSSNSQKVYDALRKRCSRKNTRKSIYFS